MKREGGVTAKANGSDWGACGRSPKGVKEGLSGNHPVGELASVGLVGWVGLDWIGLDEGGGDSELRKEEGLGVGGGKGGVRGGKFLGGCGIRRADFFLGGLFRVRRNFPRGDRPKKGGSDFDPYPFSIRFRSFFDPFSIRFRSVFDPSDFGPDPISIRIRFRSDFDPISIRFRSVFDPFSIRF